MRQLILSPRWIVWHVLTLGAMVTCGYLAAWQWQRAGSALGSALNVGYGLQWPVFALFFGYMWWHFLRLEAARLTGGPAPGDEQSAAEPPAGPADARAPVADEPSPFGPRPAAYRAARSPDEDDPELAEYNRMLAALAARDSTG